MKIEIKSTHDSIKIVTPLWYFTFSRSSIRPGGILPDAIFTVFANIMETFDGTYSDAMQSIVDNIDTLWPEWKEDKVFSIGDEVSFDYKKAIITGTVISVKKNNVNIDCSLGKNISIPKGLLK